MESSVKVATDQFAILKEILLKSLDSYLDAYHNKQLSDSGPAGFWRATNAKQLLSEINEESSDVQQVKIIALYIAIVFKSSSTHLVNHVADQMVPGSFTQSHRHADQRHGINEDITKNYRIHLSKTQELLGFSTSSPDEIKSTLSNPKYFIYTRTTAEGHFVDYETGMLMLTRYHYQINKAIVIKDLLSENHLKTLIKNNIYQARLELILEKFTRRLAQQRFSHHTLYSATNGFFNPVEPLDQLAKRLLLKYSSSTDTTKDQLIRKIIADFEALDPAQPSKASTLLEYIINISDKTAEHDFKNCLEELSIKIVEAYTEVQGFQEEMKNIQSTSFR